MYADKIIADRVHPEHLYFSPPLSDRRLTAIKANPKKYSCTVFPRSVTLFKHEEHYSEAVQYKDLYNTVNIYHCTDIYKAVTCV